MSKNLLQKLEVLLNTGELLSIVDSSLAPTQVLRKLGFSNNGKYVAIVKNFLVDNDIDIAHFTANGHPKVPRINKVCPVCNSQFSTEPRNIDEQVTCSRACSNTYFRSGKDSPNWVDGSSVYRKIALEYYGFKCSICAYSNPEALEVHHVDKNRKNNELSNLRVLCANCHTIEHKTKFLS